MLKNLKDELNTAYTENGAVTFASTLSDCLDFFATVGALRRESDEEIVARFIRAFAENPDIAMKTLFFARDVRGGLGERRVFRVILKWLCANESEAVIKNIGYISEFGRFDDLLTLIDTPCQQAALELIAKQFNADLTALGTGGEVSLLAKWLPSVNTSNKEAVRLAKRISRYLGMNDADYRKALSRLRAHIRIIENNLRLKDYTFDYSKQPSKAMFKYRKAFIRNDSERYSRFIDKVNSGEIRLNTQTLYPYELIAPYLYSWFDHNVGKGFMKPISAAEKEALNATWASLEDFTEDENALVVVDTSGSMYCDGDPKPATVAISLGIYFAERNKGAFHNHFIEFSAKPQLIELKGETFVDKLRYVASLNQVANTDIEAVFNVILSAAIRNRVPQEELPKRIYLISDMEFDCCVDNSSERVFENAKRRFNKAGYELPQVVFWNVASRNRQQPVTKNEQGVALVSGCTPRIFSMLTSGNLSPEGYMLEILNSERYAKIAA